MFNLINLFLNKVYRLLLFLSVCYLCGCSGGRSAAQKSTTGIRTLIVGGGSSHDFNRWYKQADSVTLSADGFASVTYTSGIDSIIPLLPQIDVLYLSNNQPMTDPNLRKAIFDFVESGKGLVLAHGATWYNWKDWPEYNAKLVGGGSTGHERYGNFDVSIVNANHPITQNVEKTFNIKDELYRMKPDSTGPGLDVLAIATVPGSQTTYPLLWVTKHSKGRIVGFTLGHDGEAHDLPVYQTLLKNAIKWAARK
ncbi:MAG: ThuA domain-containing protein [Chitinophagaceae bacterium]